MRLEPLYLLLITSTGCGVFGGGDSTLEDYYTDCVGHYESMANEVAETNDIQVFMAEHREWENDWAVKTATARAELRVEFRELAPREREERAKEVVTLLKDLQDDCADAAEAFAEEAAKDDDLRNEIKEFLETEQEGWETTVDVALDGDFPMLLDLVEFQSAPVLPQLDMVKVTEALATTACQCEDAACATSALEAHQNRYGDESLEDLSEEELAEVEKFKSVATICVMRLATNTIETVDEDEDESVEPTEEP